MANLPILIAGGGIAGVAAALGLATNGHRVRILEKAPVIETVGAGLQIGPNAVKALQKLGAWEALEPRCVSPEAIEIRDGVTGSTLQHIPLGGTFENRFGAPYRVAHRAGLLEALLATASRTNDITITTGAQVAGYRNHPESVEAVMGDGSAISGSHLVAADGIRSTIRAQMLPGVEPRYAGQAIYRALLPASAAATTLKRPVVTLWLAPGFHAVHYPVSGGENVNLLVAIDSPWTSKTWSEPVSGADIAAASAKACPDLAAIMSLPHLWLKWAAADVAPPDNWHDGRVVMLGDAAHAAVPYLAQGAAMALEDAVALAQYWEDFPRYTASRLARTRRVQAQSRRMAGIYHAGGAKRLARNAIIGLSPPGLFLGRLAWIYAYRPD